ncbi:MAG: ABC transporter permease subunit [Oscillospiraceae bacterium]|nr:ABC transporter permease subunit [Oscillospiraceae bacterium]
MTKNDAISGSSVPILISSDLDLNSCVRKTHSGKIKTTVKSKSGFVIKLTVFILLGFTVYGFLTFDYQNINFGEAILSTLNNIKVLFGQPHLTYDTFAGSLYQLLITFSLGALSTVFGAVIALFGSLLCAKNIANPTVANIMKSFVSIIRAVPTILWVLIFTVSAGLGSVAAVVGLTFHSAAYLIKAYAESIEEIDAGAIEALKASGASYWQIVFQAILPSSVSYITAWTFLRFEINFTSAVAVGAAAGAGGIGYDLFMAGNFYFDLHELGFITYIVVIAVIILEQIATKIKAKVK